MSGMSGAHLQDWTREDICAMRAYIAFQQVVLGKRELCYSLENVERSALGIAGWYAECRKEGLDKEPDFMWDDKKRPETRAYSIGW
jgi:hypothetical protein